MNKNSHPLTEKECCPLGDNEGKSKEWILKRKEQIPNIGFYVDAQVEYYYCYPWRPEYEELKKVSHQRRNIRLETEYLVYDYRLSILDHHHPETSDD